MVFWNYDFHTVFRTTEVSTNSLRDFAMSWNYDFHTVFNTADLSNIYHVFFFHSVVNISLESDPPELSFSSFI